MEVADEDEGGAVGARLAGVVVEVHGGRGQDPARVGEDVGEEEIRVDLVPQAVGLAETTIYTFLTSQFVRGPVAGRRL